MFFFTESNGRHTATLADLQKVTAFWNEGRNYPGEIVVQRVTLAVASAIEPFREILPLHCVINGDARDTDLYRANSSGIPATHWFRGAGNPMATASHQDDAIASRAGAPRSKSVIVTWATSGLISDQSGFGGSKRCVSQPALFLLQKLIDLFDELDKPV